MDFRRLKSSNPVVRNAIASRVAENMSAQQMVTAIEMAIGDPDEDMEWMLDYYGPKIRAELGSAYFDRLRRRAMEG